MRPIKLTMSAFGSYAGETVIDFDKLGDEGLYIISGPTGAGKTTIFDAIVFALYGEASGDARKAKMFRSDKASPDTKTYVELVFDYNGEQYTVRRNPVYEREKLIGSGNTTSNADASLIYPNGNVVIKTKEVTKAVTELIGVDRNQFVQIAMIAQGDFRKLLSPKTEDRVKIFRQIFGTSLYEIIQNRLKDEASRCKRELDELSKSNSQYYNGIEVDDSSMLSVDVDRIKMGQCDTNEAIKILNKVIGEDNTASTDLSRDINKKQKELDNVNVILGAISEKEKTEVNLAKAKDALAKEEENNKKLKERLKEEKAKEPETKNYEKEKLSIENKISNYDELDRLTTQIKEDESALKKIDKDKASDEKKKGKCENEIALMKDEKKTLKGADVKKEKLEGEKKEVESKCEVAKTVIESLNDLYKTKEDLEKARATYVKAQQAAEKAEKTYQEKNTAFLNEQAGILAKDLKDGEACPVCGSTSHPHKAKHTVSAPTKEELEELKNQATSLAKEQADNSEKCASLNSNFNNAMKNAKRDLKKLEIECEIDGETYLAVEDILNDLNNKLEEIEAKIFEEKEKVERLIEIENKLPEYEQELEKLTKAIAEYDLDKTRLSTDIKNNGNQVDKIRKSLEFSSKKEAEKRISDLEKMINSNKESLEKADDKCKKSDSDLSAAKASVETLEKQLSAMKSYDKLTETNKASVLNKAIANINNELKEVDARLKTNEKTCKELSKNAKALIKAEANFNIINALNNTANGTVGDKHEKIKLETYIQMSYMDKILDKANIRFLKMTEGHYELRRREEVKDKRSVVGLELDVYDFYTGQKREVDSLSGGEAFIASMSLALGLSDVIQEEAGGVRLDTMFIDEGFGSLDPETLELAMRTLTELADSNRLIGIISHVEELEKRIDKQIKVTKDNVAGSKVALVV